MSSHIESGTTIFIDANVLLYAVSGHWKHGNSSKWLLESINDGEYNGITSVLVCNEVDRTPDNGQRVKQWYLRQPPFRTESEIYSPGLNAASFGCIHFQ